MWAANTAQEAFLIESIAGTPAAATETLLRGYETLDRMGERGLLSTVAGFLAQALYAQGDYDEAARFSRASEDAAATDDVFSQMLWRISRAKILVRQGEFERAEALAREAVRLGEATDLLNTRADMLCDLAEVLAPGGSAGGRAAGAHEGGPAVRAEGELAGARCGRARSPPSRARRRPRLDSRSRSRE